LVVLVLVLVLVVGVVAGGSAPGFCAQLLADERFCADEDPALRLDQLLQLIQRSVAGRAQKWADRGEASFLRGDYASAGAMYSRAIMLDSSNVAYYSGRAATHAAQQQWEKVSEDAALVVDLVDRYEHGSLNAPEVASLVNLQELGQHFYRVPVWLQGQERAFELRRREEAAAGRQAAAEDRARARAAAREKDPSAALAAAAAAESKQGAAGGGAPRRSGSSSRSSSGRRAGSTKPRGGHAERASQAGASRRSSSPRSPPRHLEGDLALCAAALAASQPARTEDEALDEATFRIDGEAETITQQEFCAWVKRLSKGAGAGGVEAAGLPPKRVQEVFRHLSGGMGDMDVRRLDVLLLQQPVRDAHGGVAALGGSPGSGDARQSSRQPPSDDSSSPAARLEGDLPGSSSQGQGQGRRASSLPTAAQAGATLHGKLAEEWRQKQHVQLLDYAASRLDPYTRQDESLDAVSWMQHAEEALGALQPGSTAFATEVDGADMLRCIELCGVELSAEEQQAVLAQMGCTPEQPHTRMPVHALAEILKGSANDEILDCRGHARYKGYSRPASALRRKEVPVPVPPAQASTAKYTRNPSLTQVQR
jgi:hypothetical protein